MDGPGIMPHPMMQGQPPMIMGGMPPIMGNPDYQHIQAGLPINHNPVITDFN